MVLNRPNRPPKSPILKPSNSTKWYCVANTILANKVTNIRDGTTGCLPLSFSNAFRATNAPAKHAHGVKSSKYLGQTPAKQ